MDLYHMQNAIIGMRYNQVEFVMPQFTVIYSSAIAGRPYLQELGRFVWNYFYTTFYHNNDCIMSNNTTITQAETSSHIYGTLFNLNRYFSHRPVFLSWCAQCLKYSTELI